MPRQLRERGRVASAWILSVVVHGAVFVMGGLLVANLSSRKALAPVSLPSAAPPQVSVEIELPAVLDGSQEARAPSAIELPPVSLPRGGGEDVPRPDMGVRGRGGTDRSPEPALNLADRDEQILLSTELHSRVDRSQIQRIRASSHRATREDVRASREPMELTFLAMGRTGIRPERLTPADSDPSVGGRERGAPQRVGSGLGAADLAPGIGQPRPRERGGPIEGAAESSAGVGVRDGSPGQDHRASARVALARPMVQQGTPSVPGDVRGKPSDTLDSEQEVATMLQSIVHASNAGGTRGPGAGGQAGPGATGSGGASGPGSSSHALGTGHGTGLDNDALDRRRSDYIRKIKAKVDPLWGFPKGAALEGLQGTAIVTFTIRADGSVASATISRPSGVPEFDERCRSAIRRAAPFAPLPVEFGQSFRIAMSFDAQNPAVRPERAKPDGTDL
jgi:TonB family protein